MYVVPIRRTKPTISTTTVTMTPHSTPIGTFAPTPTAAATTAASTQTQVHAAAAQPAGRPVRPAPARRGDHRRQHEAAEVERQQRAPGRMALVDDVLAGMQIHGRDPTAPAAEGRSRDGRARPR